MSLAANDDELRRKCLRPSPSDDFVVASLKSNWEIEVSKLKKLESYDDCNFLINSSTGISYLVKFYNGVESENVEILKGLGGLCNILHEKCDVTVPYPILSVDNLDIEIIKDCPMANGETSSIATRVFSWVEGSTLSAHGSTLQLLTEVGRAVGMATNALEGFDHTAFHRFHMWDLQQFENIQPFVSSIQDSATKDLVEQIYSKFINEVLPDASQFPKSVLMGDCNDANVIVAGEGEAAHVSGLIDFGDACYSWTVNDIAIAVAYGIITKYGLCHPVMTFASMVAGFCSQRKLRPIEIKHLHTLVAVRLAASTSMGAYSIAKDPTNEYLKLHALPAQKGIQHVLSMDRCKITTLVHLINSSTEDFPLCPEVLCGLLSLADASSERVSPVDNHFSAAVETFSGLKRKSRDIDGDHAALPTLTFVTGNANKLQEVEKILGDSLKGYRLVSQKVDLPELQGSPEEVSAQKCKLAALQVTGAVMVEDTSLCFNALNGLPGVYIKWFLEGVGLPGLNNLLAGYSDKSAYAQCIFSFFKNDGSSTEPLIFAGRCAGSIVEARGPTNFGWDPVFQPDGFDKTFAELSSSEKNTISHRYKAICALREHLLAESV